MSPKRDYSDLVYFPDLEDDHCIVRVLKTCCQNVVVVRKFKTFILFDSIDLMVFGAFSLMICVRVIGQINCGQVINPLVSYL